MSFELLDVRLEGLCESLCHVANDNGLAVAGENPTDDVVIVFERAEHADVNLAPAQEVVVGGVGDGVDEFVEVGLDDVGDDVGHELRRRFAVLIEGGTGDAGRAGELGDVDGVGGLLHDEFKRGVG